MPDDVIPELQDLLGASTFSQLAREASASAPTITFDENEQTVQIFESLSLINMLDEGETLSRLETPAAATSEDAGTSSPAILEKRSLESPFLVERSHHQSYVKGLVDSMRCRPAFRKIKNSELWNSLVQSCTDFIEAHVADAAS